VGFGDLLIFANAYGASVGDPNYNAAADFDASGDVGFRDLLIFAGYYGQAATGC
jgi:hypothetical protein